MLAESISGATISELDKAISKAILSGDIDVYTEMLKRDKADSKGFFVEKLETKSGGSYILGEPFNKNGE